MEERKSIIGIVSIILVLIISILIFYAILLGKNLFNDLIILGIVSIIFSIFSYFIHAFINSKKIVSGFVWGYYILGIISLILPVTIIRFNLTYLILILIFILVSLVFINWRIKTNKN